MNTGTLAEPEMATYERLRLFSLYLDAAAAARARWATDQISRLAGERWKSSAEMWNMNSLFSSNPIRTLITQDAAEADVVVVAASSLERRPVELIEWLDSLVARNANRPASGLFVGLFGGEGPPASELDWTVEQILRCAERSDRDFVWRWIDPDAMTDCGWLAGSVEVLLSGKKAVTGDAFLQYAVGRNVSSSL